MNYISNKIIFIIVFISKWCCKMMIKRSITKYVFKDRTKASSGTWLHAGTEDSSWILFTFSETLEERVGGESQGRLWPRDYTHSNEFLNFFKTVRSSIPSLSWNPQFLKHFTILLSKGGLESLYSAHSRIQEIETSWYKREKNYPFLFIPNFLPELKCAS